MIPAAAVPSTLATPCRALLDRAQSVTTPGEFVDDATATIGVALGAAYVRLELSVDGTTIVREYSDGTVGAEFWEDAACDLIREAWVDGTPLRRVYREPSQDLPFASLSTRLQTPGDEPLGAIIALIPPPIGQIDVRHDQLEALVAIVADGIERIRRGTVTTPDSTPSPSEERTVTPSEESGAANAARRRALQSASNYESVYELAIGLVNQLKAKSGCDQVSLGQVHERHVRVLAISGFDEVKRRSPGIVDLRQAMEECLDHGAPVLHQHGDDWESNDGPEFRLHRQWHDRSGGDGVATIPLFDDEQCRYVVALRRARGSPFTSDELGRYRELVEPYAPVLTLVQRASEGIGRHAWRTLGSRVRMLSEPGHWVRKAIAITLAIGAIWFLFGTRTYEMAVSAVVVPADVRHVSAPFEATLEEVFVVPGDRVTSGQPLCRLDTESLELERLGFERELARLSIELRKARAERDSVAVRLVESERDNVEAQLAVVQYQIDRSVLFATRDGTVVVGDLRDRVGDVLRRGESLFQLSTDRGLRLDIHVPESEVAIVAPGLAGAFAPFSRPDSRYFLELDRVAATSSQREGVNVYVVEATLPDQEEWIRPGMEGVARIDVGPQPVWWITLHRVISAARTKFWM